MNERSGLTRRDLEKMRLECYKKSETAICSHPGQYGKIREIVNHVISNQVDINEYYCLAATLAEYLEKMGRGTIFHYFSKNIDPNHSGHARYFRAECLDLAVQMNELNKWRVGKRKLTVVK